MNFKTENIKNVAKVNGKKDCLLNTKHEDVNAEKTADPSVTVNLLINNGRVKKGPINSVMSSKGPQPLIAQKSVNGTHKAVFVQSDVLPTKFTKGKFFKGKKS